MEKVGVKNPQLCPLAGLSCPFFGYTVCRSLFSRVSPGVGKLSKRTSLERFLWKILYSNKKLVWLWTCESCKAIWAEKMQQVVQKESHKAVKLFTQKKKWTYEWTIAYWNKWKHFHRQFLLSLQHLVFPFCLHFCLLSHCKIIRCIVKLLIATEHILCWNTTTQKGKLKNGLLGVQTSIPVSQTTLIHCCGVNNFHPQKKS